MKLCFSSYKFSNNDDFEEATVCIQHTNMHQLPKDSLPSLLLSLSALLLQKERHVNPLIYYIILYYNLQVTQYKPNGVVDCGRTVRHPSCTPKTCVSLLRAHTHTHTQTKKKKKALLKNFSLSPHHPPSGLSPPCSAVTAEAYFRRENPSCFFFFFSFLFGGGRGDGDIYIYILYHMFFFLPYV